ncbi:aspartyl protease family protein [Sphingomonas sp.]|uniref:retropepsin-like aspartic protease n=1 Tax=Sphingomonas sp. TaxID=28214 RepID=UPI00286C3F45|nr:aspartyl protease family protein [Sphingomonas sp.]
MFAMKTILWSGAGILALAGALALAHPGHAPIVPPVVSFSAAQQTLPFDLYRGNRIITQARINGHETSVFLDTGAGATTVDRAFARSIGLPAGVKIKAVGTGGPTEAELVSGVTLQLGGMRFDKMTVAVMDLQPVAKGIGRPMNVILGREFFNSAVVSINWAASTLTVIAPKSFTPPRDAVAIPLGTTGPFHTVPLSVAGGPEITAMLDVGNGGTVSLPRAYWEQRADLANLPFADSRGGGVGGLHKLRAVTLPQVVFGGRTFANVPAELGEADEHEPNRIANVGIGMLQQFRVTLDLGHSQLYLAPGANAEWLRDRSGARFDLAGDRLKVAFVSPFGPAARAGLKLGDEIVAVDGQHVDSHYYDRADWSRGQAGRAVALQRIDGSVVTVTLADYY